MPTLPTMQLERVSVLLLAANVALSRWPQVEMRNGSGLNVFLSPRLQIIYIFKFGVLIPELKLTQVTSLEAN